MPTMFKNLIPKIFYNRLQDGLDFFVDGLGFKILYQDAAMAVIARDGAKAYIVENAACAAQDRPGRGEVEPNVGIEAGSEQASVGERYAAVLQEMRCGRGRQR